MSGYDRSKKRLFLFIASVGAFVLFLNVRFLAVSDAPPKVSKVPVKIRPDGETANPPATISSNDAIDAHPVARLMAEADVRWKAYAQSASQTFKETVSKYRQKYGRHPPPGFKDWYKFARERNVHNIDDFEQVMDDLRPFWAVEPKILRTHVAHMWEDEGYGVSTLSIRDKKVAKITNIGWRIETTQTLIERFIEFLPDMDIAMNRLDQPRVIVPWDDMQEMLAKEVQSRSLPPEAVDSFTAHQDAMLNTTIEDPKDDPSPREDGAWFNRPGKQYMDIASLACPPDSPARNTKNYKDQGDSLYKTDGGIVTNFNLSSDLCTVGPAIQDQHGFLYSASSIIASHKLIPIFGECKVNVNSDILFPANMYFKVDERYDYSPESDLDWEDKEEKMIWRGVTSGGVQVEDNWARMHRQRLVQLLNATHMAKKEVKILKQSERKKDKATFELYKRFRPARLAEKHTDVGFTESMSCVPNCDFYNDVFEWKPQVTLSSQFKSKYLIDVDGHSFSGRWRAFLQSKSLGFKATIFREWHDSRLFAWQHFVPVDNRYDDLYSLLTYFIGYGSPTAGAGPDDDPANKGVYVPRHEFEGKVIAQQGREWANKVLRREDIEVYMFRLLIEYARIVDDNRDRIGYSGDGSELDKFDMDASEKQEGSRWGLGRLSKLVGGGKTTDPKDGSQGSRLTDGIPGMPPKPG